MKTYIHYLNNQTEIIDDKELRQYVRYGQNWLGLLYKDGRDVFIPNIRINCIERK